MNIGVIGLGYVGLTLAEAFARHFNVTGYDIDPVRVAELNRHYDSNGEVSEEQLRVALGGTEEGKLVVTAEASLLRQADVFIITIPTPVDAHNIPDITMLKAACRLTGSYMRPGTMVVFESTVYPGLTEEECVPILIEASGLVYNEEFFVGYSPERVNPGDRSRPLSSIKKIISGSHKTAVDRMEFLYGRIIEAGLHKVSCIRVAEAAKVIENTQRDINIAFVNELSKIFSLLNIDTREVLEAAATKWNFAPYYPGLVGGHCIGVDPYYLAYKSQFHGYTPEMILAGRKLNDEMHLYVAGRIVKLAIQHNLDLKLSRVLVLGCTFKADCPDVRNSRVFHLVDELLSYGLSVDVYDPVADVRSVPEKYRGMLLDSIDRPYHIGVLAVAHSTFGPVMEKRREWLHTGGFTFGIQVLQGAEIEYGL